MKVAISGSRSIWNYKLLLDAIKESGFKITSLHFGDATGVDRLAKLYALENNSRWTQYYADWGVHGKAAGPIRNSRIIDYAEALIAIPGSKSKGTWDAVNKAKKKGIPVYIKKQEN